MQETNQGQNITQASLVVANWEGKVPKESLDMLKGRLMKIADRQKIASLGIIQLKSPVVCLILGLLFSGLGVDRFYKGDIGLGIAKFFSIFILVGMIWAFVDLFLVWKGIKKENFEKINNQLLLCGV